MSKLAQTREIYHKWLPSPSGWDIPPVQMVIWWIAIELNHQNMAHSWYSVLEITNFLFDVTYEAFLIKSGIGIAWRLTFYAL